MGRQHRVWGLARSDQSALVEGHPGLFRATACDASRWEDVAAAALQVAAAWSHVDALVACAGIQGEVGRAVTADPAGWTRTIRGNLDATYHAVRGFHELLSRAPGRAKVVCLSGGGATKARPQFSAYGSAKTAIVRLVETIAEEEKNARLDINALAPGAIATQMTDQVIALGAALAGTSEYDAAVKQKQEDGTAMGRALDAVEWLISARSDGISGRLLSAVWDPLDTLSASGLGTTDLYTLRRVTPKDR